MKFHIVRDGETLEDIMFLYSITEDELKEDNRHIRKWDRLIPGTKLKISVITNSDDEDIMQMEPFIEDYYPKEVNEEFEEQKIVEDNNLIIEDAPIVDDKFDLEQKDNEKEVEDSIIKEVPIEKKEMDNINIDISNRYYQSRYSSRKCVSQNRCKYYPYYIYYPVYFSGYYPYRK